MRINSKKVRKILGRIWTTPKRILKAFCTHEKPRCINMNATLTSNHFFYSENQTMTFSYTRFSVNKINVEKFFKKL
jgi:hypothetical protein